MLQRDLLGLLDIAQQAASCLHREVQMFAAEAIERLGSEMFDKASMGGFPVEGRVGERSHKVVPDQLAEGRMVCDIEGDALW